MVKEIMDEIQKAEDAAEKNLEDAKYRAKFMVDSEQDKCKEARAKALKAQEKEAEAMMAEAEKQGASYKKSVETETDKERKLILNTVRNNEEGAIALVIKEIMN